MNEAQQYHDFMIQSDKDKAKSLERDHNLYVQRQKAIQDKDSEKYYKFYTDFNNRMAHNGQEYERFHGPEQEFER